MDGESAFCAYGILRHGAHVEDVCSWCEIGVFSAWNGCHRSPLVVDALHIILVELCLNIAVGEGGEVDGKRVLVVAECDFVGALQWLTEYGGVERLVDRDAVDEQVGDHHAGCSNAMVLALTCGVDGDHAVAGAEDDASVGQAQRTVLGEGVAQYVVGELVASDVVVVWIYT